MNHDQLVTLAARWLARRHSVVLTELATTGEEPDAIGWHGTFSTLIECKTSVSDFRADKLKYFRRDAGMGIGGHRYFMAASGVIPVSEMPPNWGLLEITGQRIVTRIKSELFAEVNHSHEIGLLLSLVRRIGSTPPKCVSIKAYRIESKNRSTVGIEDNFQIL